MINNQVGTGHHSIGKLLFKIILLSIGLLVMCLGTTLLYRSYLGSNPMATAADGLSKITGTSYGVANLILNVFFLILALGINRENLGIGTLITVVSIGMYIDMWDAIIPDLAANSSYIFKIAISLLGTLFASMGLSFYIQLELGMGPLECLVEYIYKKTNWQYKTAKTFFDISLLIIGILMGGVYGLGTVLNVFLTGKIMQFFIGFYKKIFKQGL